MPAHPSLAILMIYLSLLTTILPPSKAPRLIDGASINIHPQNEVSNTQLLLPINLKAYTVLVNTGISKQQNFNYRKMQECKGLVN